MFVDSVFLTDAYLIGDIMDVSWRAAFGLIPESWSSTTGLRSASTQIQVVLERWCHIGSLA